MLEGVLVGKRSFKSKDGAPSWFCIFINILQLDIGGNIFVIDIFKPLLLN